ncbi:thioredoxin domain-containing protein [Campylobacter hyointestinalis]|uniref:thioredoxin fold domain-containing protein n=1 Tax=Campylobacter hyointestinalis TaxID=198 RepID=UPI0011AC3EAD|nr:thioredoxin fold domain-containing protein [Campylobacter hyointestinalis]TWO22320.1 thiol peroxidase [Campylobacter hyointestinalis]
MKKIIVCSSLIAASSLFAISDADILELFSAASVQGLSVKVDSKSKLEGTKFEQVVIEITDGKQSQKQVLFTDGKYIFPDVIDIDKKTSYASHFNEIQEKAAMKDAYKSLGEVLKKEGKSRIIELGNDPKKPTKYLFTDPDCPYCRLELDKIEKDLENLNLKVVMAPIPSHGEDAIKKSIAIYKEVKNASSDEQKIKIFRKYYAKDAKAPANITDAEVKKEQIAINRYFETGAIRGVPAIIDESDLK